MKKLLSIVFAGLCAGNLFAQAPQGIPYQAIARNAKTGWQQLYQSVEGD